MKVLLNPFLGVNNFGNVIQNAKRHSDSSSDDSAQMTTMPSACYRPIFKAKPDASFMMAHYRQRLCAYSRKPALLNYDLRSIYAKLAKKNNAQSAINFLSGYEEYMPDVEVDVFDFFKKSAGGGRKSFQDILYEKRGDSIDNLRRKQVLILDSAETNGIISDLDGHSRNYVDQIREKAIARIYDTQNPFSRRDVLGQIESIKTNPENAAKLEELYNLWYRLPRSFMDFDAFVVKYSYMPHDAIAQRLLSMSELTIEHEIPTVRGGEDNLGNYAPVLKLYNNDRGDMRLSRYAALNPEIDIKNNLQKYLDDICDDIAGGKSLFATRNWYPKAFRKNVLEETEGEFNLKIAEAKSKKAKRNGNKLTSSQKGRNRYVSYRR